MSFGFGALPSAESASDAERETVTREVLIEACPEEVWEALSTEEGRDRWLGEQDCEREIGVVLAEEPTRLVWWWSRGDEQPTRVEFRVVAVPAGTRVIVTETAPRLPLAMLASAFALVTA